MKLTQKLADKLRNKIGDKIRPQVELAMLKFEQDTVNAICNRIKKLALDNEHNYDLEYILNDIRSGGYKNDKEKCVESN